MADSVYVPPMELVDALPADAVSEVAARKGRTKVARAKADVAHLADGFEIPALDAEPTSGLLSELELGVAVDVKMHSSAPWMVPIVSALSWARAAGYEQQLLEAIASRRVSWRGNGISVNGKRVSILGGRQSATAFEWKSLLAWARDAGIVAPAPEPEAALEAPTGSWRAAHDERYQAAHAEFQTLASTLKDAETIIRTATERGERQKAVDELVAAAYRSAHLRGVMVCLQQVRDWYSGQDELRFADGLAAACSETDAMVAVLRLDEGTSRRLSNVLNRELETLASSHRKRGTLEQQRCTLPNPQQFDADDEEGWPQDVTNLADYHRAGRLRDIATAQERV